MSRCKLKNPFKSKSGARKALSIGYGVGFLCLFSDLLLLSKFNKNGYIVTKRAGASFIAEGWDAKLAIYGMLVVSLVMLSYTIYLTVCYVYFSKNLKNDFPENITENIICPGCGETNWVSKIPNKIYALSVETKWKT